MRSPRRILGIVLGTLSVTVANGQAQAPPSPVVVTATGNPFIPLVSVSDTGRVHVVWHEGTQARHAFSDNGGGVFSTPQVIPIGRVESIATGAGGTVYMVGGITGAGGNQDVSLAVSTDGGVSFAARNISNDAHHSFQPVLAAHGDAVYLLWQDWQTLFGPKRALFSRSTDRGTVFEAPRELFTGLFFGFGNFGGPSSMLALTTSPSGMVVAATNAYLTSNLSDATRVWVTRSIDGGAAFDPAAWLLNGTDIYISTISVAADSVGAIHATWHSGLLGAGGSHSLKYSVSNAGTLTFGVPQIVVGLAGSSFSPLLSVDAQNRPTVVWSEFPNPGLTSAAPAQGIWTQTPLYAGLQDSDSLDPLLARGPDDTLWVTWTESGPSAPKSILLLGNNQGPGGPPPSICNLPRTISSFEGNVGGLGLAEAIVSNQRVEKGLLKADVQVLNYVQKWWFGVTVDTSQNVLLQPNLGTGVTGLAAFFGLVPPCDGNPLQCNSPGAAAWSAGFCTAGTIDLTLGLTVPSWSITFADLALPGQPIATLVRLAEKLQTVPKLGDAAQCLAKMPRRLSDPPRMVSCAAKAFRKLAKDEDQLNQIARIILLETGIPVSVDVLIDVYTGSLLGLTTGAGNLITFLVQTIQAGDPGVLRLQVVGQ